MTDDKKAPPPDEPEGGDTIARYEEDHAKALADATTSPGIMIVRWKSLNADTYWVLEHDGQAAGWVSRELDPGGRERIRYGVGGVTGTAKSVTDGRSFVVMSLAESCRQVGMALKVEGERREDGTD